MLNPSGQTGTRLFWCMFLFLFTECVNARREKFWENNAKENLEWLAPFDQVVNDLHFGDDEFRGLHSYSKIPSLLLSARVIQTVASKN